MWYWQRNKIGQIRSEYTWGIHQTCCKDSSKNPLRDFRKDNAKTSGTCCREQPKNAAGSKERRFGDLLKWDAGLLEISYVNREHVAVTLGTQCGMPRRHIACYHNDTKEEKLYLMGGRGREELCIFRLSGRRLCDESLRHLRGLSTLYFGDTCNVFPIPVTYFLAKHASTDRRGSEGES